GEAFALVWLGLGAMYAGDLKAGLAWVRQVQALDRAAVPGGAFREAAILMAGGLCALGEGGRGAAGGAGGAGAGRGGGAGAVAGQAGSVLEQGVALQVMADLDRFAGRLPEARAHLREAIDVCSRTGFRVVLPDCLDSCGYLCAATARWAEAITVWA